MGGDPEVEIYDDLPLDLRAAMFDACSRALNEAATARGVDPDDAGALRTVGVSQGLNDDGDPWLRLVATDGTSCYLGWTGDSESAIESATEFGRNLADDISLGLMGRRALTVDIPVIGEAACCFSAEKPGVV